MGKILRSCSDFSIRTMLQMFAVLTVVGLVVVFGFLTASMVKQRDETRFNQTQVDFLDALRGVQFTLIEAQKNSVRYMADQELADFDATLGSISRARQEIGVLAAGFPSTPVRDEAGRWQRLLDSGRTVFVGVADGLMAVGLGGTMGFSHTLTGAAVSIQERLHRMGDKLDDGFYRMRLAERDFLIRPTPEAAAVWRQEYGRFKAELERATVPPIDRIILFDALGRYADSFRRIIALKHRLARDMRQTQSLFQQLIDSLNVEIAATMARVRQSSIRKLENDRQVYLSVTAISLVVGFLVFAMGRWIGRQIELPLMNLVETMRRLARGELDLDIPARGLRNQIGEMARALEVLRKHGLERRRVQCKLVEANRRTQDVIRSMNEALLETDRDGRIIMANPAAEHLLGVPRAALEGQRVEALLCEGDGHEVRDLDHLVRRDPSRRLYCRNADGTMTPVAASVAVLQGDRDDLRGAIVVMRDVSVEVANEQWIGQFKSVLDLVAAEVYMFEPSSLRMIYMNHLARKITGHEGDDISCLTINDFDCIGNRELFETCLQELSDGRCREAVFENTKTGVDGTPIQVEIRLQLIHPRGHAPRFVAFAYDITERRNAEIEIRRFKDTLDATDDAVFMFHVDSLRFIYLNDRARAMTGWSMEEVCEKAASDINPIFDEARFRALVQPLIFGLQKSISVITTGLDLKPVELTVELFHPDDADPWFVVTTHDISRRVETENENRVFRQTLDLSQDAVYMFWSDTLTYLYQNQAARRVSGWTPAEYRTRTLKDMNPDFDEAAFRARARPLIEGRQKQIVYETRGKNGRPIEVSLELICPRGAKPRFVSISRDISERKAAEQAKKEFISTVSHELRTPLTSIRGALGVMQGGAVGPLTDEQKALVAVALGNSARLNDLINDILDIEKIEAGKMEFDMTSLDLASLVEESVTANSGYAAAHDVTFVTTGTDQPVHVRGDHGRLMQVMANLLSNAAKFSNPGDRIEVVLERQGDQARVSVIDCGCGIPEAARATIFDKFTQADSSDRRRQGGTGLGLSIVRRIIEVHGGSVDFVSETGQGTTFFFSLGIVAADEAQKATAA